MNAPHRPSELQRTVETLVREGLGKAGLSVFPGSITVRCAFGLSCTGVEPERESRSLSISWPIFSLPENQHALRDAVLDALAALLTRGSVHGRDQRHLAHELGCDGAGAHFLTVPEDCAMCSCAHCLPVRPAARRARRVAA